MTGRQLACEGSVPGPSTLTARIAASRIQLGGLASSSGVAEALAVFKLLFFRGKDIVDLERLVATQQQQMDLAYVRRWVADMMGEEDPRVSKWDELVRLFG